MGIWDRLSTTVNGQLHARATQVALAGPALTPMRQADQYQLLKRYYLGNSLYGGLSQAMYDDGLWHPALKSLRSPAYSVVEFHAAKCLSGPLQIEAENDRIVEPIEQVWQWSNWEHRKIVFVRWLAIYGDALIKVVRRDSTTAGESRIYFQLIEPQYMTALDNDERGFLTYLRLDVPQMERQADGSTKRLLHTEVWDKAANSFRLWVHDRAAETPLDQLGTPREERAITDFGVNFIPAIAARWRDIGEDRGIGAFLPAIDLIDEANQVCTRLHQMAYRYGRPLWALEANMVDKDGRPIPAPIIGNQASPNSQGGDTITLGDDQLLRLPGLSKLVPLVPAVPYADLLAILNAHMQHLERVLPELAYYRLRDMGGDLSGRAVRLLLSDAIDRALEGRANAEEALQRADEMALTLGAVAGLFNDLGGTYEDGAFEHHFAARDVIPLSAIEEAEEQVIKQQIGVSKTQSLTELGYTDEQIQEMAKERQQAQQEAMARSAALARDFTAGRDEEQE